MAEKRFTMIDHDEYCEGDCIYYDNGVELGSLDVLDKLNELYDENERLKSELLFKEDLIQQMKIKLSEDYYEKWKKCNLKYIEVCEGLLEENKAYKKLSDEKEQLKFELKECREHKLFSRRQLEEENEQLKEALREELQDNGNAYYIEIFDEIFNLNYDEWDKNEEYRECTDWERVLKDKGDMND